MAFVMPKVKQICADTGYDGTAVTQPMEFVATRGVVMILGAAAICFAMEQWIPAWSRHRNVLIGIAVFLINTAILVGLLATLILLGIAAPALARGH